VVVIHFIELYHTHNHIQDNSLSKYDYVAKLPYELDI